MNTDKFLSCAENFISESLPSFSGETLLTFIIWRFQNKLIYNSPKFPKWFYYRHPNILIIIISAVLDMTDLRNDLFIVH